MSRPIKKPSAYSDQSRLIDLLDIPLGTPVELAVLSVKQVAIRCKHIATGLPLTYRNVGFETEGEIITVLLSKVWQFKNTVYLAGETIDNRIDVTALNLVPLKLNEKGLFDPDKEGLFKEEDPYAKYYLPIVAFGPRKKNELERVIPFDNPDEFEDDPIISLENAIESGDKTTADQILGEVLVEDLRCIDAHARLGNLELDTSTTLSSSSIKKAIRHFEIGVKITELSFGPNFNNLLPWYYLNNRSYLRCLYGYGECLYRLQENEDARKVFEKLLWLNPDDHQGVRALIAAIDAASSWSDLKKEEYR